MPATSPAASCERVWQCGRDGFFGIWQRESSQAGTLGGDVLSLRAARGIPHRSSPFMDGAGLASPPRSVRHWALNLGQCGIKPGQIRQALKRIVEPVSSAFRPFSFIAHDHLRAGFSEHRPAAGQFARSALCARPVHRGRRLTFLRPSTDEIARARLSLTRAETAASLGHASSTGQTPWWPQTTSSIEFRQTVSYCSSLNAAGSGASPRPHNHQRKLQPSRVTNGRCPGLSDPCSALPCSDRLPARYGQTAGKFNRVARTWVDSGFTPSGRAAS